MREAIFPRTLGATLLAFLLVAVSFVVAMPLAHAAGTALGGAVTNNFQTWEPSTSSWVPGNATGYTEGEVAAFSVEITVAAVAPSTPYFVTACFEYFEGDKYAFIDLQQFDLDHSPTPRGGTIGASVQGAATDWGLIDDVTPLSESEAASKSAPDSIAYTIDLTTGTAGEAPVTSFYVYFGGTLAAAGLETEYLDTVPSGGGVGSWPVGVFQAWLEDVTGNKTVNFKPGDILVVSDPSLSLVKSADPLTYDAVGQTISYSYTVTNNGNVTITDPIVLSDNQASDESCDSLPAGGLLPGDSIACTASDTITQADLDFGSLTNVATASAGDVVSNEATATVTAVPDPALTLVKSADPLTYDAVGQTISYSYTVTNNGNVTITDPIVLSDNQASDESCDSLPAGGLLPGDSIACTASDTITQADLDFGSLTNVATASAGDVVSNEATATVTAVPDPALTLVKSADPLTYDAVGQTISYSYTVTNNGNVTITDPIVLSDNQASDESCDSLPAGGLLPGDSIACTASDTITQADLDFGSLTNVATASAGDVVSNEATATVYAVPDSGLTLVKSADPLTYDAVGQTISYSYTVTNNGNVTITDPIVLSDNQASDESCDSLPAGGLLPGDSIACTASDTITQADLDFGSLTNVATASAGDVVSNEATATVYAVPDSGLTLVKSADPLTYDAVGQTISYSYTVTNNGNVTITDPIVLSDNQASDESCDSLPAGGLLPGDSIACTASDTITQADLDFGSLTNVATASAGDVVSNEATATVTAVPDPALTLVKSADPLTYDAVGQTISYSYTVTNNGNVTITDPIVLSDNQASDESCDSLPAGGLLPGDSIACTASDTITQADLDFGSLTNVATASAGDVVSNEATATVRTEAGPGLQLDKTASPTLFDSVGDVIDYIYLLTNVGDVTLYSPFTVDDDKASVTCPSIPTSLAPDASITCTATYTITQADLNAGTVTNIAQGFSGEGEGRVSSNEDTATVTRRQIPDPPALGSIGNLVWEDRNSNGIQDPGEPGVAGITVELYNADTDVLFATQVTDANGNYLFENLQPGDYYLVFVLPDPDDDFITPNAGIDPGLDSDADNVTIIGRTPVITVLGNVIDNTWDAGVAFVAVGGVQITTTTPETLPFTGANFGEGGMAGIALALLALGGVALLSVRRREEQTEVVATGWSGRLWDVE